MDLEEIRKEKERILRIAAKYGVKKVYTFGSV